MSILLRLVDRLGLFTIIALLWIIFIAFANGFLSSVTMFGLSRTIAITTVVGLSQMVVLSIGQMNLSVGAIGGMVGIVTGYLLQEQDLPIWLAIIGGLLAGTLVGGLNGLLVVKTGINAFVVTLGMGSVITGLVYNFTKAEAFRDLPRDYVKFGKARWIKWDWLHISPFLFIAIGITVLIALFFGATLYGRRMLATGANLRTAKLSGVPTDNVIIMSHAISGLLAGAAGIMLVSRLGSALPSMGNDWLLPSFVAPIVGGTLLSGGGVAAIGTLLGAILVESVSVGLTLLNVPSFWIQLFIGLVLLFAVLLDRVRTLAVLKGTRIVPTARRVPTP